MTHQPGQFPRRRIAAIDLGTNSFHAVIVDVSPDGTFSTVDALKEMVHFGKFGVGNALSEDQMELGITALRKIRTLCDSYEVEEILAYATSALREAPNGGEFIQRSIDEIQIKILAIPGTTEAELIGHAVQHAISLKNRKALVVDIGGGSTEFIITDDARFYFVDSRKIGVSRMTAEFIKSDPATPSEIKQLEKFYESQLGDVFEAINQYKPALVVGTSGTMNNIAAMLSARKKTDTSITLNEFIYSSDEFMKFYERFRGMNRKQRLEVEGLDSKRVDFIVAGTVLLGTILRKTGIKKIKTSTQAMREGIILRYIKQQKNRLGLLELYPDARRRSIHELLVKCNWHEKHSTQVSRLALQIFDALQHLHKMSDFDRELLEYAALTHDIGYHISHKKHHKHALYLILNADLKGFRQDEIEIIAHVARYHRRSAPKPSHKQFMLLSSEQKKKIRALAGILRVADGLDRSHFQNVKNLSVKVGESIHILIDTVGDPELEIWGAMRKRELFEKLFRKRLEIYKH